MKYRKQFICFLYFWLLSSSSLGVLPNVFSLKWRQNDFEAFLGGRLGKSLPLRRSHGSNAQLPTPKTCTKTIFWHFKLLLGKNHFSTLKQRKIPLDPLWNFRVLEAKKNFFSESCSKRFFCHFVQLLKKTFFCPKMKIFPLVPPWQKVFFLLKKTKFRKSCSKCRKNYFETI